MLGSEKDVASERGGKMEPGSAGEGPEGPPSLLGFACSRVIAFPFHKQWRKSWILDCFTTRHFFSTVYNILLCLHIFSVHIIHQSKKRNYDSLEQLSYDSKRGPKVYLHGQCTPPTNLTSKMMNLATGTRKN